MHDHDILGENSPICDAWFIDNKRIWQIQKRISLLLQIRMHYLWIVLFTALPPRFFFNVPFCFPSFYFFQSIHFLT